MSKAKGGELENCSRIKDGNGRLAAGENVCARLRRSALRICIIRIQKRVKFITFDYDGARRGNYLGAEPVRRNDMKVREKNLTDGKVRLVRVLNERIENLDDLATESG